MAGPLAGLVKRPEDWAWGSCRAHAGLAEPPPWLESIALHRRLAPRAPRRDGPAAYARFVAQGKGVRLWDVGLRRQVYLGDDAFITRMQAQALMPEDTEIPHRQRRAPSQPLAWYFGAHDRDESIFFAYTEGGHTKTDIAEVAGMSVSRVSRLIKVAEAKGKTRPLFFPDPIFLVIKYMPQTVSSKLLRTELRCQR